MQVQKRQYFKPIEKIITEGHFLSELAVNGAELRIGSADKRMKLNIDQRFLRNAVKREKFLKKMKRLFAYFFDARKKYEKTKNKAQCYFLNFNPTRLYLQ